MNGRKPQRFVPFSQGSRDCVGQTLARLNLTTTLAQLYGNFSFQLAPQVMLYLSLFLEMPKSLASFAFVHQEQCRSCKPAAWPLISSWK